MHTTKARTAYQTSEAQAQIHPVKLIHLLYERVLVHLTLAEQGTITNNAKERGENLSKAIAIISELNASIKDGDDSDAAGFLRGLYSAILLELPKVGISGEVEIIRQSYRYLNRLREIWESTAMVEAGLNVPHQDENEQQKSNQNTPSSPDGGAPPVNRPNKFTTMDAASCYLHGVSVSI
ncbi:MAG: flagellar protein FliS [Proteobacteria bacterium]|nr:flagellar protein FliS [Desulfobulbaceae bacterium]MBU4152328.1 flagellar protein FliS [Pseudomonadota bacterium]MDP2105968.1 flagellar protein FliS [Desulfobulbaceae bacterium]